LTDRAYPSWSARAVPEPAVVGRELADGSPSPVEECEVCGSEMYGLHCKLVCPNCGYRRDCSDP
jgi:hypothetical protein